MRTSIDAAGRIVIPKELRDRLDLRGGRTVDIHERDGRLEIEPTPTGMALVRRAGRSVAVPKTRIPPLTDAIVRDTLERTRR
jgi:AbrB family looped-hinge helix DNA binding protein